MTKPTRHRSLRDREIASNVTRSRFIHHYFPAFHFLFLDRGNLAGIMLNYAGGMKETRIHRITGWKYFVIRNKSDVREGLSSKLGAEGRDGVPFDSSRVGVGVGNDSKQSVVTTRSPEFFGSLEDPFPSFPARPIGQPWWIPTIVTSFLPCQCVHTSQWISIQRASFRCTNSSRLSDSNLLLLGSVRGMRREREGKWRKIF